MDPKPPPPPISMDKFRKALFIVRAKGAWVSFILCRYASQVHQLHEWAERLSKDAEIPDSFRVALVAELKASQIAAWEAYNQLPDGRLKQLADFMGYKPPPPKPTP